jgi:hypothetical protein
MVKNGQKSYIAFLFDRISWLINNDKQMKSNKKMSHHALQFKISLNATYLLLP